MLGARWNEPSLGRGWRIALWLASEDEKSFAHRLSAASTGSSPKDRGKLRALLGDVWWPAQGCVECCHPLAFLRPGNECIDGPQIALVPLEMVDVGPTRRVLMSRYEWLGD